MKGLTSLVVLAVVIVVPLLATGCAKPADPNVPAAPSARDKQNAAQDKILNTD